MDELSWAEATALGHQNRQHRVGSDIERNPQKEIGASLIELAAEPSIGDIKLE
jgi:hypothetical protein